MGPREVMRAWGRILQGNAPTLSIEITRECPLTCPGCYAYGDDHLGGGLVLRELRDLKGQALIDGVLDLVRARRPLHVSIVGGEPLVRFRELDVLLPRLTDMGVHVQLVTSAVRPIPAHWVHIPRLNTVVSIDGLQPEHDARRKPATYDRILTHIAGQRMTVHCTVTRQQVNRPGYIEEFLRFWSAQESTKRIWISLYTPQIGEVSSERLTTDDRRRVVADLLALRARYPKLDMSDAMIAHYNHMPASPDECIFSKVTECVSADLRTAITPCQFGGTPDCTNCGCAASAGFAAIGDYRVGGIPLGAIFKASLKVGDHMRMARDSMSPERAAGAMGTLGEGTSPH